MSIDTTYPHIEKLSGEPVRLKRLPRIRIAQIVLDYLAHGWSVDEMCRQHPKSPKAEAHVAMSYYFDHQAEIDAEIESECQDADAASKQDIDSSLRIRLRAKGLMY